MKVRREINKRLVRFPPHPFHLQYFTVRLYFKEIGQGLIGKYKIAAIGPIPEAYWQKQVILFDACALAGIIT